MSKLLDVTVSPNTLPATGPADKDQFNALGDPTVQVTAPPLGGLDNVTLGTPADGDALAWSAGAGQWVNRSFVGAALAGAFTFTANPGTDQITLTNGSPTLPWCTGTDARLTSTGTLPAVGASTLQPGVDYFLIRVSATVFQLASSLANAMAGVAINMTDAGTGTHTLTVTAAAGQPGLVPAAQVSDVGFLGVNGLYSQPALLVGAVGGSQIAFTYTAASDTLTVASSLASTWQTGTPCYITSIGATPPGGLALGPGTTYYLIRLSPTTFKLANSLANAQAGTWINITTDVVSTFYLNVLTSAGTAGLCPAATGDLTGAFLRGDGAYAHEQNMVGAQVGANGTAGLVPAPLQADLGKTLSADGTWKFVSGVPKIVLFDGTATGGVTVDIVVTVTGVAFSCTLPADWVQGGIYLVSFGHSTIPAMNTGTLNRTDPFYAVCASGVGGGAGTFNCYAAYADAQAASVAGAPGVNAIAHTGTSAAFNMCYVHCWVLQGLTGVMRVPAASDAAAWTGFKYRIFYTSPLANSHAAFSGSSVGGSDNSGNPAGLVMSDNSETTAYFAVYTVIVPVNGNGGTAQTVEATKISVYLYGI